MLTRHEDVIVAMLICTEISLAITYHVVNGRLDLVNLFPVKLDLKPFIDAWGNAVTFKISAPDGSLHFCGVNVSPNAVNTMQTENVTTTGASPSPLHSAALMSVTNGGVPIVHSDYLGSGNEPGVLAFEAVNTYGVPKLSVMFGGTVVLEFELPISLSSVRDMYRWLNIRSACGGEIGLDVVHFLYYLNPNPLDRNLEWDMKNNLCPNPGKIGAPQP